jgi:hypothetical protein
MGTFWDNYFSYSIFLSYLYFGLLSAYAFGNGVAALVFLPLRNPLFYWALGGSLGAIALIYLSFLVMAFVAYLASKKDIQGHRLFRFLTLFYVPIHYLGYFKIMGKVFLGRTSSSWEEIARVKNKEAK